MADLDPAGAETMMKLETLAYPVGGAALYCRISSAHADGANLTRTPDETGLGDLQLLGKRIFEDARLSEPQGMACLSCQGCSTLYTESVLQQVLTK